MLLTDTAGLRDTDDAVERIGVERAKALMEAADVLVWLGHPDELPDHPRLLRVHARADLPERASVPTGSIPVSSRTGEGLAPLLEEIGGVARSLLPYEDAISLNRRQAAELSQAHAGLVAAAAAPDFVILAECFRAARAAFDRLTGRAGVEDVLDALFGRFCLGK
jgi:tRNA modification GTPase